MNGLTLGLVTLLVPDYNEAISFFERIGFRLVADEDQGRKRWVEVEPRGGGAKLLLARAATDAQEQATGNQTGGRVAFFLYSHDFGGDAERISATGGTFLEEPRDEVYGRVAQWADPWGNLWDLIEPADV